jgi:hypothetical protein
MQKKDKHMIFMAKKKNNLNNNSTDTNNIFRMILILKIYSISYFKDLVQDLHLMEAEFIELVDNIIIFNVREDNNIMRQTKKNMKKEEDNIINNNNNKKVGGLCH